MRKLKTIIALMGACVLLFSCGNNAGSSDDLVESTSTESEVKIGTQTWSTKNLDVSTFRNGEIIPEAKTEGEWKKAIEDGKPAWCYYDNDPENGKKYGKLYNWYAVNDPRGLAPQGWHVPSDAEWTMLTDYLGGEMVAGTKMKSTKGWDDYEGKSGNGTNESGFTGSPGGSRHGLGMFGNIGSGGVWWSSSEPSTHDAWARDLNCNFGDVARSYFNKSFGFSVRCLRD